ncbi:hypothetical protein WQ54_07830 [Bacillus sp. SA1-12]|uniref:ROK family transcriptional regulator n=1 Tax=Bacillus sp. SA1-12 TaxID=1455638 RepID=UPI000626166F|nr:ROK family transcriptional regulator [Bacillus sp. SA1-12]KKI92776.1 hypothetical protein WQ54_07830 [Bacillus sp. SA1-12]
MGQSGRINIDLMKDYNKKLVLKTIQRDGPISRVDIANSINLSRPSVSEIVAQLIDEGWIQELVAETKVRGRTPRPLEVNPHKKLIIGVEIGAYATKIIICNLKAEILKRSEIAVNTSKDPCEVIKNIASLVTSMSNHYVGLGKEVIGLGVGMHGLVDSTKGVGLYAPNLGWKNVDIKGIFEDLTKLPVEVENDCNSSALAEVWFGHGRDEDNFISVLMDYGIGASVINNGTMFKGVHHVSGQIGHITIDPDGPRCTCGNYGCLEILTSEPAILKGIKRRLKLGERSSLTEREEDIDKITIEDFYQAVHQGDPLAVDVAKQAGRNFGLGFTILINLFGPRFIVIGGGLVKIAPVLLPIIKEVISLKAMGDEAKQTPIFTSLLGEDLYAVGAASLIVEKEFSLPTLSI